MRKSLDESARPGSFLLWGKGGIGEDPIHPVGPEEPGTLCVGGDGVIQTGGGGESVPEKDFSPQSQVGRIGTLRQRESFPGKGGGESFFQSEKRGAGGGGEIPDPALKVVEACRGIGCRVIA